MMFSRFHSWLSLALLLGVANSQEIVGSGPMTIVVGEDASQSPSNVGWTDGVCYKPMTVGVHPGDILEFTYAAHNVYQMASKEHFMSCNFTDGILLSQVGDSPFRFEIPEEQSEVLYFGCQVADHCATGTQKLQVFVSTDVFATGGDPPVSSYVVGSSIEDCQKMQESPGVVSEAEFIEQQSLQSECSDPILGDDGYFSRTCLSGPATLTPGGVINRLFVVHYPFPMDHRVAIGQRTFEFVSDIPDGEGVNPVPVSQLYVHHLSGRVVFGQGSEGLRQTAPDSPFPKPYTALSGDEGDSMIFHLIDLREVDDWLGCLECRCPINSGVTYLDSLTNSGNITGGVSCCSNCTDLTGPTLDYRMRYNVSYRELDDEPVRDVKMLTADISVAVGKMLEHDVPSWQFLPKEQQAKDNPYIQRLEIVKPFKEIFNDEFFEQLYSGPNEVKLIRCVAHLHVASIEMRLDDAETGESLCDGRSVYGKDPETDAGFLTSISVTTHDPPITFNADRVVRFTTDYNATEVHTGVMGYWFLFIAGQDDLTHKEVNMTVGVCLLPTCDASMLPEIDMAPFQPTIAPAQNASVSSRQGSNSSCVDTLSESPACTFGGLCECEEFVNAPESSGCDGFYASSMGDVEVRSVCANYCGCDVDTPVEEGNVTGGDCVDTLASSPSCSFGGLCDCETFVNAPESSGCDGVFASPMGDIEVRPLCASYCGCEGGNGTITGEESSVATVAPNDGPPATSGSSPLGCADSITESPICRFAGICECEAFVNSPDSEGCGGMYTTEFGSTPVNDVCAVYCGACVERTIEEIFEEAYMEVMAEHIRKNCLYATAECQAMLSNLYSCGSGKPGIEDAHPMIQTAVTKKGPEVALAGAQLGESSLHVGEVPKEVGVCSRPNTLESTGGENNEVTSTSGALRLLGGIFSAMMVVSTSSLLIG